VAMLARPAEAAPDVAEPAAEPEPLDSAVNT
jgi:hypothetical protein